MSVRCTIVDGPLSAHRDGEHAADPAAGGAGAILSFDGVVRAAEDDRVIEALDYEAYEPMACDELRRLAADVLGRHGLRSIAVWHSRGRVAVGECSFRLVVTAAHRAEALRAMAEFIDRMKRDVPIWKRPVWAT